MIGERINYIRIKNNLSQEGFADLFGVSRQAVQKWETGVSQPDLNTVVKIARHFNISIDFLVLGNDKRIMEEAFQYSKIIPQYENPADNEVYSNALNVELRQCREEGLDIEQYAEVFETVSKMPSGGIKEKLADVLFETVCGLRMTENYPYDEPSDIDSINELKKEYPVAGKVPEKSVLKDKILGAWQGRIAGCLLGKPVEGITNDELVMILKEAGNYPLEHYVLKADIPEEMYEKVTFPLRGRCFADDITETPSDDDTNYTVLYQKLIEQYGRDFTALDVIRCWIDSQPKRAYCTAERVAFCNGVKGFLPPDTAIYKNPYREWIGAQIRADYFGYINPGNPKAAANMAFIDASISHTKNGIYGEMFAAAMIALSAITDNAVDIIEGGIAQIPHTSRLYEVIKNIIEKYKNGVPAEEVFRDIRKRYQPQSECWIHTLPNAEIVAAALLYSENDFTKGICMAVECGYDTDCNGATVGSILGMTNGAKNIDKKWTDVLNNQLNTDIFGVGKVKITDLAEKTMEHIEK